VGALIDTSIFVAAERGKLDLPMELSKRAGGWFGMAAVTAAELLEGVEHADTPARRQKRSAQAEQLISTLAVVSFDVAVAREYARLPAKLRAAGTIVGVHDLQIAATAIVLGHAVATRDERSFPRIPGVNIERW
jgi:tRNA(fMet)-specific endonuclease VapC